MSTNGWIVVGVKCRESSDTGVSCWSAFATAGDDFHTSHVDLMLSVKKWFLNGIEQEEQLHWPDMKSADGPRSAMDLAKRLSARDFEKRRAEAGQ